MARNQLGIEELADEIRREAGSGKVVTTDLATSQRIIARVTDGIYREPWAAFRELIANAYDADATRVIVDTGAPEFSQVVVRDNGHGMSPDAIAYVLKSIGGSSKRTEVGTHQNINTSSKENSELSPGGRPLIGKIGIGLFAVAQLTQHFQIISKSAGSEFRTSATIQLKTHNENLDSEDESDYVAGKVSITTEKVNEDEIESHGTTIILYSLRPEIRRTLQSVGRWQLSETEGVNGEPVKDAPNFHIGVLPKTVSALAEGVRPVLPWGDNASSREKFRSLVEVAEKWTGKGKITANLEYFDDYFKLIWKLSLALPLNYLEMHPFDLKGSDELIFLSAPTDKVKTSVLKLKKDETVRDKFDLIANSGNDKSTFNVFVDDIELSRPVVLPKELRKPSRIKHPMILVGKVKEAFRSNELTRAGGQLSFEAYLYWNSKIVPKETSGVLIRVREASGTLFDAGFLKYQVSEQNRLSQITAEIFVHEGLDSAINIDRESFNYSHPHYLFIQKWLHRSLKSLVGENKKIAKKDLDTERTVERREAEINVVTKALEVWKERKGNESDLPIAEEDSAQLIRDVDGSEIDWLIPDVPSDTAKASAIAVVLEAYGLLAQLKLEDRTEIIKDLLKVMEEK